MAADYTMTRDLLEARQVTRPVAEIHGVLCGQLCAEGAPLDIDLSRKLLEIKGSTDEVITGLLKMLADDIENQLRAGDYSFQLLLPDDEQPISERLAALAHWCDGFNAGFAGAWVREAGDMSKETREVLSDFSRIAQVEQEDEATDRENEVNLMEIVEYARMAAITVFLQNAPTRRDTGTGESPEPDVDIH